jgi:HlyD family secretion protein
MRKNLPRLIIVISAIAFLALAIAYLNSLSEEENDTMRASGTVEAIEVAIASEISGRVAEVLVDRGDVVEAGEVIFLLDDAMLQLQRERTLATIKTAETALDSAKIALQAAQLQLETTLQAAHLREKPQRVVEWEQSVPEEFSLPTWYFTKIEELEAVKAEVDAAKESLEDEEANLETILQNTNALELIEAETRVVEARITYDVASDVLERALGQEDKLIIDFAQNQFDAANTELDAAYQDYERLLSTQAAEDILEVRARVSVASERYYTAMDKLALSQSGEFSLDVKAAQMLVDQAMANVNQGEAALNKANVELTLVDLQIEKLVMKSPINGVVTTRDLQPGEVITAGAELIKVAQLDNLIITVFLQEDRYGVIDLGDLVEILVDSFPNQTFQGSIERIADEAEFTPRNVQTSEGRRTTVFAVEVRVNDPLARLKPGMPADVLFGQ